MATMFVRSEVLNLRSAPVVSDETELAKLDLNQSVETSGVVDGAGWISASATVGGQVRAGFVKAGFLRKPASPAVEALLAEARTQWRRFEYGKGEEHRQPFSGMVGEMWRAIGLNLDGEDRDQPWSAAAISFMVRNAGRRHAAYNGFAFAAAHSRYVHDAIRRRNQGDTNAPFWGFRRGERAPQLGDIVCVPRAGSGVDFDHATSQNAFKSHCDIVVAIDPANFKLLAIGGNVSHSVETTEYPLGPGNFLTGASGVFAVLANRADEI